MRRLFVVLGLLLAVSGCAAARSMYLGMLANIGKYDEADPDSDASFAKRCQEPSIPNASGRELYRP